MSKREPGKQTRLLAHQTLFRLVEAEGQTPTSWRVGEQQAGLLKDEHELMSQWVLNVAMYFVCARVVMQARIM